MGNTLTSTTPTLFSFPQLVHTEISLAGVSNVLGFNFPSLVVAFSFSYSSKHAVRGVKTTSLCVSFPL
jgi:hypothetical protein